MSLVKPTPHSEVSWLDHKFHYAVIVPFLAVLTPFAVYMTNRGYPLMSPEIWLIIAGMFCVSTVIGLVRWAGGVRMYALCVSGLLTVGADHLGFVEWVAQGRGVACLVLFCVLVVLLRRFEKTATLVITSFLCVFVMSTVIRNGFEGESIPTSVMPQKESVTDGSPRLIHLILDEHLGIEGIPVDTDYARKLKHKIKELYRRYGFTLYGGAYSHYFETIDSIPNLLNFSSESLNRVFVTDERPPYQLRQNRYFQFMKSMGYRIHVIDGDFLDFCSSPDAQPQSCIKYRWATLSNVAKLDDPTRTKVATALAVFVASYPRYQRTLDLYEQQLRPFLVSNGLAAPVINPDSLWTRRRLQPFSVNTMAAMDILSTSIQQLTSGHMLFAHLLLPHFPYVYRGDCSQRAIPESMDNTEKVSLDLRTTEGRMVRFDQYLRQVECLYVKLDEILEGMQSSGMFDDSIVIIHGDHGARLGLRNPTPQEQDQLTVTDYVDGLSTLFAVKMPGQPGGYYSSLHAIDELFVQTLGSVVGKAPSLIAPRPPGPFAYLYAGSWREQLLVEMPWRPSN